MVLCLSLDHWNTGPLTTTRKRAAVPRATRELGSCRAPAGGGCCLPLPRQLPRAADGGERSRFQTPALPLRSRRSRTVSEHLLSLLPRCSAERRVPPATPRSPSAPRPRPAQRAVSRRRGAAAMCWEAAEGADLMTKPQRLLRAVL